MCTEERAPVGLIALVLCVVAFFFCSGTVYVHVVTTVGGILLYTGLAFKHETKCCVRLLLVLAYSWRRLLACHRLGGQLGGSCVVVYRLLLHHSLAAAVSAVSLLGEIRGSHSLSLSVLTTTTLFVCSFSFVLSLAHAAATTTTTTTRRLVNPPPATRHRKLTRPRRRRPTSDVGPCHNTHTQSREAEADSIAADVAACGNTATASGWLLRL